MWKSLSTSAILLFLFGFGSTVGCNWNGWSWNDKIDLRDVRVLTLRHGHMTTGRRWDPIPQLKCVGGSAGCEATPKVVQCYNRGGDGINVQWECKATLDERYDFGEMSINCEGYNSPTDPTILAGSCGLEYTLEYANEGNRRPHRYQYRHDGVVYHHYYHRGEKSNSPILINLEEGGLGVQIAWGLLFIMFVGFIIIMGCRY